VEEIRNRQQELEDEQIRQDEEGLERIIEENIDNNIPNILPIDEQDKHIRKRKSLFDFLAYTFPYFSLFLLCSAFVEAISKTNNEYPKSVIEIYQNRFNINWTVKSKIIPQ